MASPAIAHFPNTSIPVVQNGVNDEAWLRWFRGLLDVYTSFTPTWTGLTVVGTVTYTAEVLRRGQSVWFTLAITPSGGGTVAATAGSSYLANLPFPVRSDCAGVVMDATDMTLKGGCRLDAGALRVYLPTFSATTSKLLISGKYRTAG